VGFANTFFEHDRRWGALLDNLHVGAEHQRRGLGARLLALTAQAVSERPQQTGLYLWVLEQNTGAQAFYEARGGRCVGRGLVARPADSPAGSPPDRRRSCATPGRTRRWLAPDDVVNRQHLWFAGLDSDLG